MTDETLPADPMTDRGQSWVVLHEMYRQARAAGFAVVPACVLLAAWVVIHSAANEGDDEPD